MKQGGAVEKILERMSFLQGLRVQPGSFSQKCFAVQNFVMDFGRTSHFHTAKFCKAFSQEQANFVRPIRNG